MIKISSWSPKQNNPKVKHPKTHINQTNKDQTQTANIEIRKGKQQIMHQGVPYR